MLFLCLVTIKLVNCCLLLLAFNLKLDFFILLRCIADGPEAHMIKYV